MRRLRAVAIIAVMWAVASLPIGAAWAVVRLFGAAPTDALPTQSPIVNALLFLGFWEAWALLSGAVFAALVSGLEAKRDLGSLTRPRFALWGALGGVALPLALTLRDYEYFALSWRWYVVALAISAAYGALCALGMLGIAKRQ